MIHAKPKNGAAVLTLLIAAPLIMEVLPGYTRFSSLFVFPIEVCVWGGGALLIRYAVRKGNLHWTALLLLGLALSVAEEFLIQQTSVAPMVLRLKGVTYARGWDINYVYLLWALIAETVFVVFVPVHLTELLFPQKRQDAWISKTGAAFFGLLFIGGSFLAWFTWTQIARPKVFHVSAFHPPLRLVLVAAGIIILLVTGALVFCRPKSGGAQPVAPREVKIPARWLLLLLGALWAILLYPLVLLGFGLWPYFPPLLAILGGLLLCAAAFLLVPRWSTAPSWDAGRAYALISGVITGSMLVSFVGFVGAAPQDLWFKVVVDLAAWFLLIRWRHRMNKR